jgi:hypothetical protein
MPILGATAENRPLIEESYRRMLDAFEPFVGMRRYLFGSRPSLADFAWYGQLSELATDPTPMRILRARAPMLDHWVRRLDDASGVDGDWGTLEDALAGAAGRLLALDVLARHPGHWTIAFQHHNTGAGAFWRRTADEAFGSGWAEEERPVPGRPEVAADHWIETT